MSYFISSSPLCHYFVDSLGKSRVNVIDSNRPGDVILTFDILSANILCIATVAGNCNNRTIDSLYETLEILDRLGVKDNDYGPPPEPMFDSKAEEAREERISIRSESDGSSKGDTIIGSIRYVSCSVAGSDPVDQPNDNDNEGIVGSLNRFCL